MGVFAIPPVPKGTGLLAKKNNEILKKDIEEKDFQGKFDEKSKSAGNPQETHS